MRGSDEKIWKIYRTFRGEEDLQLVLEPAAWFRIGVAAANRGRWDDAQLFWQQALEGDPELEPAEFYLEVASLVRGERRRRFGFLIGLGSFLPLTKWTYATTRR